MCLKDWFDVQYRRSSGTPLFTCPSCRAAVRETRPNATVTTLLDIFLAANPDSAKPQDEKNEIAQKYKHGESVFPPTFSSTSSGLDDNDDASTVPQVGRRSTAEQQSDGLSRRARHQPRQSSRPRHTTRSDNETRGRNEDSRRRTGGDRETRRQHHHHRSHHNTQRTSGRTSQPPRRIEHQSSLRSLLSLSDRESIQEEILREIVEGGLLDGIDLDSDSTAQEEELSERIADAYRQRHRRSEPRRTRDGSSERPATSRSQAPSSPAESTVATVGIRDTHRDPPVSRPQATGRPSTSSRALGHQRNASDQGVRRHELSSLTHNLSSSDLSLRPAARSASDMSSDRSVTAQASTAETSGHPARRPRRATESEHTNPLLLMGRSRDQNSLHHTYPRPATGSSVPITPFRGLQIPYRDTDTAPSHSDVALPTSASQGLGDSFATDNDERVELPSYAPEHNTTLHHEPSMSCERCGKRDIQYDVYKNCSKCKDGEYNICLRCYRLGKGCLQWTGFGASVPSDDQSHTLLSFKYKRPSNTALRIVQQGRQVTDDDPSSRLETGLFCDRCQSNANDSYWKCSECNEGDWGFCGQCMNQGKCCTHALLPICLVGNQHPDGMPTSQSSPSSHASSSDSGENGGIACKALSVSTICDICTCPIATSMTRFHCLECNAGDYDICANCYFRLVAAGKISKENGHQGWRRCLHGHRMEVVGFERWEEGEKRVIIRALVGGHALKDNYALRLHQQQQQQQNNQYNYPWPTSPSPELGNGDWSWKDGGERRKKASRVRIALTGGHVYSDSSSGSSSAGESPAATTTGINDTYPTSSYSRRFPPDGGVGLIVQARWSWFPEDEVEDELMFPHGAEITEAENINDDWFWGCYAGQKGLFPGGHVVVIGEVA